MIDYLNLQAITARHITEIEQAMDEVVKSGWYLRGEATRRFEQHYAQYIGSRHCIGCGNGLDALTLILRAYIAMGRLREGDEVLVPANTYIASILSITENGLKPILVEPDLHTLQIDDSLIESAITPKTRALMIVHLYGAAPTPKPSGVCARNTNYCSSKTMLKPTDADMATAVRVRWAMLPPTLSIPGKTWGHWATPEL